MMNDKTQKRLMIGVSAFVLVAIIGIAYAAFTGNLSISGTGMNRKSNYDIYFDNVSNFLTTGTASVTNSNPTVRNHTTVIEDYEATLVSPGDSIYFTFDIVNDGDYDATLTSLTLGPVACSVNGNENDSSAQNVCSNIEYTLKYDNGSNVTINDTIGSKETKEVKVTLTYKEFSDASELPTSNVSISNLGIDLTYSANNSAKTNSNGSTPYEYATYQVGNEITLNNEKYYVLSDSGSNQNYVTLLKAEALTVNEVNTYGGVGTENNHVNKYGQFASGSAYNDNGYGGLHYYGSANCSYRGNGSWGTGCESENATNYDTSDIKYVIDNWAMSKFTNNELKKLMDIRLDCLS